MRPYRNLPLLIFLLLCKIAYGQQDVDFHLGNQLLNGKTILKVKRDFADPYLWVLAKNNEVYRINSITLVMDDYTTAFAAYSTLPFIDIAGSNQNMVFVATNTTNVIENNNGVFTTIGSADGLLDPVTSLGISNFSTDLGIGNLIIGTGKGRGQYNPSTNQLVYITYNNETDIKVFDATYRSFLLKADNYDSNDPALFPIAFYGSATGQIADIYPLAESGTNVTTAYYALQSLIAVGSDYGSDIFWGNEKGMFQEPADFSGPYGHYLDNINVNKIADIFGLTSFGDPTINATPFSLTKENLLIGTDNGLYFTSSIYGSYDINALRTFSLFHFDPLGTVRVNDICVNGTSATYEGTPGGCEDGVWVACDNGLYLLRPDYGKYFDPTQQLQAISFNLPSSGTPITQTQICQGDQVQLSINGNDVNNNTIQWQKDGKDITGATGTSITVTSAGDYSAILYSSCENIHVETNHLTVQVISAPVFSFNYPALSQYCGVTSTVLQTDNNPLYKYRWYTNGVLNGATTYNYTVTQSGKYKVEVSACTNSWVPSKEIEVDLINLPIPVISADKTQYCAGENAVLTANIPTDPSYTINWYKDGNVINTDQDKTTVTTTDNGNYSVTVSSTIANCTQISNSQQIVFTPAPVFSFNYPDKLVYCDGTPVSLNAQGSNAYNYRWYTNGILNGDITPTANITQSGKYKVEVSACDGSWVPSKEVQVDIIKIPTPTLQADKPSYCMGDNATLTAGISTNPSYNINWYKDNVILAANSNQTSLVVNENGSYSVAITSNEVNTDGTICTQTAVGQNIVFNPPPTVSIQQIVKTTLCDGQTVDLKVSYNTGRVKWSTGQNSDLITIGTSGSYSATVTSTAGCTTSADINVQFFPNPILNLPSYAVCVPSKKTATLTAPEGMTSYTWNGQSGTNTYVVDHPETITLIVTDANGCQATQDVQVVDECPNISIPNAFTPNGDGINDTWDIVGLEYDQTATVKIFTRNGQQVFESKGYPKPWDGQYKGKQLPSGVYYYIIKTKNNSQTYSGPLTIIY